MVFVSTIELPKELQGGETRLGNVQFRALHSLAAGQIVDEDGLPLDGAVVRAARMTSTGDRDVPKTSSLYRPMARSGKDGRFTLEGRPSSRALKIRVLREGYRPQTVAIPAGPARHGIRVVLSLAPPNPAVSASRSR